jgi:hypothetical protein
VIGILDFQHLASDTIDLDYDDGHESVLIRDSDFDALETVDGDLEGHDNLEDVQSLNLGEEFDQEGFQSCTEDFNDFSDPKRQRHQ